MPSMVLLADESSNMVGGIRLDAKNTSSHNGQQGMSHPSGKLVLTLESEENQEHGKRTVDGD